MRKRLAYCAGMNKSKTRECIGWILAACCALFIVAAITNIFSPRGQLPKAKAGGHPEIFFALDSDLYCLDRTWHWVPTGTGFPIYFTNTTGFGVAVTTNSGIVTIGWGNSGTCHPCAFDWTPTLGEVCLVSLFNGTSWSYPTNDTLWVNQNAQYNNDWEFASWTVSWNAAIGTFNVSATNYYSCP